MSEALTVESHLKKAYKLNKKFNTYDGYYQIYKPADKWQISKTFDLYFIAGGARYYILADGTLISGYNDFSQETLKTIYDFFNENIIKVI